jgi:hypothetical protein
MENIISQAKELISKLKSWKDGSFTDADWALYFECALLIQKMDSHDIIHLFENERVVFTHKDNNDVLQSRLFILLRIIFDLPVHADISLRRSFKGWENWPDEDEEKRVNLSWPVNWKNGQPYIEDSYQGSMGKPYALIDEFNYFKSLFKYRKI